jgi:pimeloyl-ACP methyl ester carboxylesterase
VHVPALVVWGASDSVDPVSAGRAAAQDLHAPFVEIPQTGHLSMLASARSVVVAILKSFAIR